MPRVLVTNRIPDDILAPLHGVAEVDLYPGPSPMPRDMLLERVAPCRGLLCMLTERIDAELLAAARSLEVVSQMAVGVDNIDLEACRESGVVVGHTPDVLTGTVADTAFALMAAVVRRIPEGVDRVRRGEWGLWDPWVFLGSDLHRRVLGIVGMGRIGHALVRRATGFDMEVLFSSRSPKEVAGARQVGLEVVLAEAEILVLAAPLSPATHHVIGREQFHLMRNDSYLVNVARGPLVDTDALVEALATGEIAGAALDVTDPEPLPPDHELLRFPNCVVVPHIGSASERTRRAMADLAVRNLVAGLRGDPVVSPL